MTRITLVDQNVARGDTRARRDLGEYADYRLAYNTLWTFGQDGAVPIAVYVHGWNPTGSEDGWVSALTGAHDTQLFSDVLFETAKE